MIKTSPKLTRFPMSTIWRGPGPYNTSWMCSSGLERNWIVDEDKPCWVVISDKPTRGAIRITKINASFHAHIRYSYPINRMVAELFNGYTQFERFLRSFGTNTVWLWIEVEA